MRLGPAFKNLVAALERPTALPHLNPTQPNPTQPQAITDKPGHGWSILELGEGTGLNTISRDLHCVFVVHNHLRRGVGAASFNFLAPLMQNKNKIKGIKNYKLISLA